MREQIIQDGKAVIFGSLDQTVLQKGARIYVLWFGADGSVSVVQSGIYDRVCMSTTGSRHSRFGDNDPRLLIYTLWDGETQQGKHTVASLGIDPEHQSEKLVVTCLDGITAIDKRPFKQRRAHPLTLAPAA